MTYQDPTPARRALTASLLGTERDGLGSCMLCECPVTALLERGQKLDNGKIIQCGCSLLPLDDRSHAIGLPSDW